MRFLQNPGIVLFAIVFLLLSIGGCGNEKIEPPKQLPEKKVFNSKDKGPVGIEPYLNPKVEIVTGGESYKGPEAILRDVIVKYNKAMLLANLNISEVKGLDEYVTTREYNRIYASLELDRSKGEMLSGNLSELHFKEILLEDDKGTVKTKEDWYFEYRDIKTGKTVEAMKDFEYNVTYHMVKKDGSWLVNGLDIEKAAEYFPIRRTPKRVHLQSRIK